MLARNGETILCTLATQCATVISQPISAPSPKLALENDSDRLKVPCAVIQEYI
jgi:hypothetical protein